MFNLFKRKQNLVPKDVKSGMLTSNFVSFKVGEKLEIPENIICLIRFKDKTYKQLEQGEYSLNKEFIIDLYTKQLKNKSNIKNIKADLYFINLSSFKFEFEFTDKLPLNNVKEKFLFNVILNLQVEDCNLFSKTLIYDNTAPSAESTKNLIIDYAEGFLRKYFLKQKLNSANLSETQNKEISIMLSKNLKKLGLSIGEVSINLFKKTDNFSKKEDKQKPTIQPMQENIANNENLNNIEINKNNNEDTKSSSSLTANNPNICPQCKSKLIKGSIFCHKCGYKK